MTLTTHQIGRPIGPFPIIPNFLAYAIERQTMEDHEKFAILAIRAGEVRGMCGIADDEVLRETVTEWALDPTVTSMIRVPIAIARKSFDATEAQVIEWMAQFASPSPNPSSLSALAQ